MLVLLVGKHSTLQFMNSYSREVEEKAKRLFDNSFNSISFELLKEAVGEDSIIDYIERPSDEIIEAEAKSNFCDDKEWEKLSEDRKEEEIDSYYFDSEHYPIWGTVFEAKDELLSDKIMRDIDGLYKIGIGVISPTDNANACLFIAGAGYNFYDAHWIPLFEYWGWLNMKEIKEKAERARKAKPVDLQELKNDKNAIIKRHARGLIEALNL